MPNKPPCPRCRKTGFVRFETVLKGGNALKSYYCGACNHAWEVAGDGSKDKKTPPGDDRPDRSRSR